MAALSERVCGAAGVAIAARHTHQIRAGVAGGKGVPEQVGDDPLVFATLTAPSFGPVRSTRGGRACRPSTTKGHPLLCEHGWSTVFPARHTDGDELLGQPLCRDCYDYESRLVWQCWTPELWRRFTIDLLRALAKTLGVLESRLADVRKRVVGPVGLEPTTGGLKVRCSTD